MTVKSRPRTNKNPPILSHEFVIQNHADIVACIAMLCVVGLIFQVSAPIASIFIALQHNTTKTLTVPPTGPQDEEILYTVGWKDTAATFFYTLIAIVMHALIQEYSLDKLTRKLHLSKIRHSKFNDAGQLLAFALFSSVWGGNLIFRENLLSHLPNLWDAFPHTEMSFGLKFFMIAQISYWIHWLPEIYFMKTKRDEIPNKVITSAIYTLFIGFAYLTFLSRVGTVLLVLHYIPEVFLNLGKLTYFSEKTAPGKWLFLVGNVLFIAARFVSLIVAVLTFWFGLEPFASQALRYLGLGLVGGLQCYLLFQFAIFHARRLKKDTKPSSSLPKSPKKKQGKESDLPEVDQNTQRQTRKQKTK